MVEREGKKGTWKSLAGWLSFSIMQATQFTHIYTSWHHRKCGERRWLNGNIYDIQMEDWKQYIFYWNSLASSSQHDMKTWWIVNSVWGLWIVIKCLCAPTSDSTACNQLHMTITLLPISGSHRSHTMCPAVYSFLNFQYLMNIPPLVCGAESWRSFIDNFIVAAREFGGCIQYSRECVSRWGSWEEGKKLNEFIAAVEHSRAPILDDLKPLPAKQPPNAVDSNNKTRIWLFIAHKYKIAQFYMLLWIGFPWGSFE